MTFHCSTIRVISHLVFDNEPLVQYVYRDRANNGEQRDDGGNPERPGVRPEVSRNNVGSGLSCELSKVSHSPDKEKSD